MVPAATASEPGAKIRAAPAGATWWRSFGGFGRNEAIQIDQQNQAAVGCDRGSWEELHAAQVFAEIFDDDFIFAEDVLDDDSFGPSCNLYDHHAVVAVDRLDWRQA